MPSDISLQQRFIAGEVRRIRNGLRNDLQDILETAERGLEDLTKARMPPKLPEYAIASAMRRLGELEAYQAAGEVLGTLSEEAAVTVDPAPKTKKVRR